MYTWVEDARQCMGLHKPPSCGNELKIRVGKLDVEVTNQFHQSFIHFHYAYVPAGTDSRTLAELPCVFVSQLLITSRLVTECIS